MTTPSRAMHVVTSYHASLHRPTLPGAAGMESDDSVADGDGWSGDEALRYMSLSQP